MSRPRSASTNRKPIAANQVVSQTFGLKSAVVNCTAQTTLDDFAASILLPQSPTASADSRSSSPVLTRSNPQQAANDSYFLNNLHPSRANHRHNNSNGGGAPGALRALTPLSATSYSHNQPHQPGGGSHTQPQIANVVLARDLDRAPRTVQIQALELLRTRRIFTRTSVQAAPKQFLFLAVLGADSAGQARVTEHLNDFFYIAHWHDPEDGFARLDEREDALAPDTAGGGGDAGSMRDYEGDLYHSSSESMSGESVVRRRSLRGSMSSAQYFAASSSAYEPPTPKAAAATKPTTTNRAPLQQIQTDFNNNPSPQPQPSPFPYFSESDIAALATASRQVHIDIEVRRYQMNIVSHLRMHRAVAAGMGSGNGVTPAATKHFDQLTKSLAALHGLDYVTPALVVLAAKKIYLHRVRIVAPDKERSMQWGSDLAAVEQLLEGVGPEDVVEDVINMVPAAL